MLKYYNILLLSYLITKCSGVEQILNTNLTSTKSFMFWQMARIPFYINPDHFDTDQIITILSALAMFEFKTCLKFMPLLNSPGENRHVLTFINPDGIKRCKIQTQGHSNFHPHLVQLGYECLESPYMEMIIMRALGFPYEHNRMSRDVYIDVMIENIEPTSVELFTKESFLPSALRAFPYDINSVMHFGERDFSKNGHRTIKFKNPNARQNRVSLTGTDLKKIEVVYGPECQSRDRREKIEQCKLYPRLARKKRETFIDPPAKKSLRVNPDITPPPSIIEAVKPIALEDDVDVENEESEYLTASLKALGIVNETEHIIEQVYKVSALALKNARAKYCNETSNMTTAFVIDKTKKRRRSNVSDILGILEVIADYAKSMVDNAVSNLTIFCKSADSIDTYQRQCKWSFNDNCPRNYRSTNHGPVRASTQHRPTYKQQTRHIGGLGKHSYDRARKSADEEATTPFIVRRKRDATNAIATPIPEEHKKKGKKIVEEVTEINHDNSTLKLADVTTSNSMPDVKKSVKRRFFQHRRHRS